MIRMLCVALLCLGVVACKEKAETAQGGTESLKQLSIVTTDNQRHDFEVALAITPEQQRDGLMNVKSMPENAGMLFLFEGEDERHFWMKDTLIPLDIIFIKKDGTIMQIYQDAVPGDEVTSIRSYGPAMAVLEINAGLANKLHIFEGDKVHHKFFGNALND
jgi:uncharacterized membrane protein (UPF0127 family)